VAACAARKDRRGASLACAQGMQLALLVGLVLQCLTWLWAPDVITCE
jgi:Na+-driven multidrug efflux pump